MELELLPTYEEVFKRIAYDPLTGILSFKVARKAAPYVNGGYVKLLYNRTAYYGHRLAWLLMTKTWPPCSHEIDHINKNGTDNRWNNLRLATHSENGANRRMACNNKSGFKGVSWCSSRHKWSANIRVAKRLIILGRYEHIEDAAEAYQQAAIRHFGEFYSTGLAGV